MSRLAKLHESDHIEVRDMGGNGTLPGSCPNCGQAVDFKDKDTLVCRNKTCGWFLKLESIEGVNEQKSSKY